MRILLAIDGSAAAGRARDLVDGLDWPADSLIRVVAALGGPAAPAAVTGWSAPRAASAAPARRRPRATFARFPTP